jgi:hypothetical protein
VEPTKLTKFWIVTQKYGTIFQTNNNRRRGDNQTPAGSHFLLPRLAPYPKVSNILIELNLEGSQTVYVNLGKVFNE